MLGVRILSAVLLLPLLLWGYVGGPPWLIVLMNMSFAALSIGELGGKLIHALEAKFSGTDAEGGLTRSRFFIVAVLLGMFNVFIHGWTPNENLQAEILPHFFPDVFAGWLEIYALFLRLAPEEWMAASIIFLIGLGAFAGPTIPRSMARMLGAVAAFCYGTIPWIVVMKLCHMGPSSRYVILVMAITWMGDTGAYFGGRFLGGKIFGKRPFAPQISPKKTWEGSLVGLAMSVLGAWGANVFYGGTLAGGGLIIALGIFGGFAAQMGDLVESFFKRFMGIKDSGTLIPGHGGFLDRTDGTFFCGPMVWVLLKLFG